MMKKRCLGHVEFSCNAEGLGNVKLSINVIILFSIYTYIYKQKTAP